MHSIVYKKGRSNQTFERGEEEEERKKILFISRVYSELQQNCLNTTTDKPTKLSLFHRECYASLLTEDAFY